MIIAIKQEDKVYVASTITDSDKLLQYGDLIHEDNLPVKYCENADNTFVAFASGNRISDMFLYDEQFIKNVPTEKTIVNEVIPMLKEKLTEENLYDEKYGFPNSLVIVHNGDLYSVSKKLYLRKITDYFCCGYGTDLAEGILISTKGMPVKDRIRKVMDGVKELLRVDHYPVVLYDVNAKTHEVLDA